jgi:hypothetical protein
VKLTTIALIAAGYVFGAKAGHERYEQITAGMEAASQRLEEFSTRGRPPGSRSAIVADRSPRAAREPR